MAKTASVSIENPSTEGERSVDSLFGTKDMQLLEMWDTIQTYQVDFAFFQELSAFYLWSEWDRARTVIDIGTGNGYYVKKMAQIFPEKSYLGIDLSKELIEIANTRHSDSNIVFEHCDLFETNGSYDVVIMRLVLQHLNDVDAALKRAAKLTNAGGCAIIIDAHDPWRIFRPEVPEFRAFFKAYTAKQGSQSLKRDVAENLPVKISKNTSWAYGDNLRLLLPSTIPGNLELFRKSYALMIRIVEKAGILVYDYAKVKAEWEWWCGLENAYTQAGLNIIRIDRI